MSPSLKRRVMLVNPPMRDEEVYGAIRGVGSHTPPLGILYLAAWLRSGYEVALLDGPVRCASVESAAKQIIDFRPDVLGLSATTLNIHAAARLAERVSAAVDVTTIVGGPHVTAVPEETFRRFPAFDFAVIGEGEAAFAGFLKAMFSGGREAAAELPSVVSRGGGGVRVNPRADFIADLDTLPFPAWDLLPNMTADYRPTIVGYDRLPSTSLVTSRGCPGQCTFCSNQTFGRRYRYHGADYVLGMIRALKKKYGIRDVVFYDDVFVADRRRLEKICDALAAERPRISWSCAARINLVTPDILAPMKKAGCWQIGYGIESGSPEILKNLKKKITVDRAREVLTWTKKAGIATRGFFIFGSPGETERTLKASIDFALSSDLDYFQQSFMTPYPGSELYDTAAGFGEFDNDWRAMNNESILFVPAGLTKETLQEYSRLALRKFYFRPKVFLFHLRMLRNPHHLGKLWRGFATFVSLLVHRRGARAVVEGDT